MKKQQKKEKKTASSSEKSDVIDEASVGINEIWSGNNEENPNSYDMHEIVSHHNDKKSKKRKSKKNDTSKPAGLDFHVDLQDDRFAELFQSSSGKFGIDRISSDFKDTENMRAIIKEQQKRRKRDGEKHNSPPKESEYCKTDETRAHHNAEDLTVMIEKLKKKGRRMIDNM